MLSSLLPPRPCVPSQQRRGSCGSSRRRLCTPGPGRPGTPPALAASPGGVRREAPPGASRGGLGSRRPQRRKGRRVRLRRRYRSPERQHPERSKDQQRERGEGEGGLNQHTGQRISSIARTNRTCRVATAALMAASAGGSRTVWRNAAAGCSPMTWICSTRSSRGTRLISGTYRR